MSSYKRFVSYIFSYENGVKKDNVGYARIENYNDQCRINIYMKDAVKRDQKASVYLFYRDEGKIQGIFMKEITIKNGFGDCKIITESENIGGTPCSFENIGGIIIYITANRFWGTEWDDKPIYGFAPVETEKQQIEISNSAIEIDETEKTEAEKKKTEEKEVTFKEESLDKIETKQKELKLEAAVIRQTSEEMEKRWCELREAVHEEEKRYFEENAEFTDNRCDNAKEIDCFAPYTKVYPFYEQDKECIGVTPKDLIQISPILKEWQKNDFVLYSYDRFRHILLLRKKGESEKYFIGVPGMYRPSEEKLAGTYGFSMFMPMRKETAERGDFGYWCAEVEMG